MTFTSGGGPPSAGGPAGGGGGAAPSVPDSGSYCGARYTGGGAGAIPVLVLIVMMERGNAWPVGLVPTTEPFDAALFTGVGASET